MSDFFIGLIRTWTPILVGGIVSWFVAAGIVDPDAELTTVAQLTAVFTTLVSGLYYTIVRFLAEKWPGVGVLLGYNKAPAYNEEN